MISTKNFTVAEIRCRCEVCNRDIPHPLTQEEMDRIQNFRTVYGVPFTPSSAFRCELHKEERDKVGGPGEHNRGAIDVGYSGSVQCYRIVAAAIAVGCTTIIIYGDMHIVHIDWRAREEPLLWSVE